MISFKLRSLSSILMLLLLAGMFVSCSGKIEGQGGEIDVEFMVPSTASVSVGELSLTFKVLFKKAPLASDVIVLEDARKVGHDCAITQVNEKSFTIALQDGFQSGTYGVSLRRGGNSRQYGEMRITVDDGNELPEGCTVYGKVSCGDKALKGVVVSDGVEVVATDDEGYYYMKSAKKFGYVFVSVPSGYETAVDGVLPKLWQKLLSPASEAERVDFEMFEAGDQTNHKMLVLGDMHLAGGRNNDSKWFREFCQEVDRYVQNHKSEKVYAVTLGDMTWDYYWYEKNYQFAQYLNDVKTINDLMIFHTIGNHDHDMNLPGDFDNAVQYMTEVAPDFYSFNIGEVHYIVLDDILSTSKGGGRTDRKYNELVTDEQLAWLAKDLSFVPKSKAVVVTMHATTSNLDTEANRTALFNSFAGFDQVHFFTGHTHQVANKQSGNWYDHNCGAVCADWWDCVYKSDGKVHIGTDGAPAGYEIFDIKGTDFSWRFKGTGIADDIQFRSYDRNNIHLTSEKYMSGKPEAQVAVFDAVTGNWKQANSMNEVYLNVWNYGPGWNIEVTEDGKPLTVTKSGGSSFRDPLHILVYMPTSGKTQEDSFTTKSCSHMWMVTASSSTSTLEIKVTDNFGNVYTETMTRPKPFDIATYSR